MLDKFAYDTGFVDSLSFFFFFSVSEKFTDAETSILQVVLSDRLN